MSQRTDEFIKAEQKTFAEKGIPPEKQQLAAESLLAVFAVATSENALETLGRILVQLAPTFDVAPVSGLFRQTMKDFTVEEFQDAVEALKKQPEEARLISLSSLMTAGLIAWKEQLENAKRQYTSAGSSAEN